jgi:hypothetical protein
MVTLFELKDWSGLVPLLAWVATVAAIRWVIFESFVGQEIRFRWQAWQGRQAQRIHVLQWELKNRARWDPRVQNQDPLTALQPLSDEEIASRRQELVALGRKSTGSRLWGYFITCPFCQSFWIALVLLLAFARADGVAISLSAVMYGYLVSRVDRLAATTSDKVPGGAASQPGRCSGCR